MNRVEAEANLQQRIDEITKERNQLAANIKVAKANLTHLVNHWDEYSKQAMIAQVIGIVEEVL